MNNKPIGANVKIKWKSDGGLESVYMSFAPEVFDDYDAYGVHDDYIFYYTTLEELQTQDAFDEWEVIEFSLVCAKEEV